MHDPRTHPVPPVPPVPLVPHGLQASHAPHVQHPQPGVHSGHGVAGAHAPGGGVGVPLTAKPRRVRGGVRLSAKQLPLSVSWSGRGWLAALTAGAGQHALHEGLAYARSGQVRALEIQPGRLSAMVQGRAIRPYRVSVQVRAFAPADWDRAVEALATQASHAARLLAGEVPESISEVLAGLGLALVPAPEELSISCAAPNERPACKHVCCVALLLAEALEREPFSLFTLRGLNGADLLERLRRRRHQRTAAAAEEAQASPETQEAGGRSLEDDIDRFWEAGPGLATVETAPRPPEVSHALLRRLGPSPFPAGSFPVVGLLATCYDAISRAALAGEGQPEPEPGPEPGPPA